MDMENAIKQISGNENYMESLQQITGDIMQIDSNLFKQKLSEISKLDKELRKNMKLLEKTSENNEITEITSKLFKESIDINVEKNSFVKVQKKRNIKKKIKTENGKNKSIKEKTIVEREELNNKFKPIEILKTEWFKIIKNIEKLSNKLIEAYTIDRKTPSIDIVLETYKNNPSISALKNFYGIVINTQEQVELLVNINNDSNKIIEIYLTPMYNIRETILKNWFRIENVFKTKAFQHMEGSENITQEDIIIVLKQFIIAKYRASITGNNKYFVKLFMSLFNGNENEVGELNSGRFLEIIDSIDMNSLDKKDNVYKFALASKNVIQKIYNKEKNNDDSQTTEDLIKEIQNMFVNDSPEIEPQENIEIRENNENGDILGL